MKSIILKNNHFSIDQNFSKYGIDQKSQIIRDGSPMKFPVSRIYLGRRVQGVRETDSSVVLEPFDL